MLLTSPWEQSRKCSWEVGVWCWTGARLSIAEGRSKGSVWLLKAAELSHCPVTCSFDPIPLGGPCWERGSLIYPTSSRHSSFLHRSLLQIDPSNCLAFFSAVFATIFSQLDLPCWLPSWFHLDLSCETSLVTFYCIRCLSNKSFWCFYC